MDRGPRIRPDELARRALGGFYSRMPEPERKKCGRCGAERINVDKNGICSFCRYPRQRRNSGG